MQRSQSALSQQLMVLSATLLCLVFTRFVSQLTNLFWKWPWPCFYKLVYTACVSYEPSSMYRMDILSPLRHTQTQTHNRET